MLKVKVNDAGNFNVNISAKEVLIDGKPVNADWIRIGENKFHVLAADKSYTVELQPGNSPKERTVIINGVKHQVEITSELDDLLHQLGMDKLAGSRVNTIKAPMPGLVLRVTVEEGQKIHKGDPLLVLEAMKMENVIKAQGDGTVKKIHVSMRMAVDKNQVLMEME